MQFILSFQFNENIYLRNPDSSDLGKKIVKHSIDLIKNIGFEAFTFKKLATEINSTEATIYRYFENKHKLLLYIITWYWFFIDFYIDFHLQNITDSKKKIKIILDLLTKNFPESDGELEYNKNNLYQIVIAESSKVYLIKEVEEINNIKLFKPYKDLCSKIASVFEEYNPNYPYPKSLSSTVIETSHQQMYFSKHLPRLTDINNELENIYTYKYLDNVVFSILNTNKQ